MGSEFVLLEEDMILELFFCRNESLFITVEKL